MEKLISLAEVNNFYRLADLDAIQFLEHQDKLAPVTEKSNNHLEKYAEVFSRRSLLGMPTILGIPGHLAAGFVEGLTLAPLFKSMMKGVIGDPKILEIAGYMPIAIFWGVTLMVGQAFHKVNLRKDLVQPQKFNANWPELAKGVVLGGAYIYCLLMFTWAAEDRLGDANKPASVIFWIGLFELILGYFSISGWETLYAYGKRSWNARNVKACAESIHYYAHRCEQHYTYYEQAWRYYNLVEGTNYTARINARIEAALAFGRIQTAGKNEMMVSDRDFMI